LKMQGLTVKASFFIRTGYVTEKSRKYQNWQSRIKFVINTDYPQFSRPRIVKARLMNPHITRVNCILNCFTAFASQNALLPYLNVLSLH